MPYDDALAATREALSGEGFGILTEIDLAATMKAKLDVDLPPQVILVRCRPALAYEAIQVDPSIAAVLPCNVVVRSARPRHHARRGLRPGRDDGPGRHGRAPTPWPPTPSNA